MKDESSSYSGLEENIFSKDPKKGPSHRFWSGLLLLVFIGLIYLVKDPLVGFLGSSLRILSKYSEYFIKGLKYTLGLSIISVFFGSILGTLLYFLRSSKVVVLKKFSLIFIELIRGTPLITQLSIVFFGSALILDFKSLGLDLAMTAFVCGIIAVSINSGAYISEIIRSGIQSVPKGQMEAGRSLGLSHRMTMREIILPQAIRNILPALGNEFIALTKETAIVSSIGVMDIMYNVNVVRGSSFKPMEPLMIAAVMYFVLTFGLSKLVNLLERRLKTHD